MEIKDFLLDRKLDCYAEDSFVILHQVYSNISLIEKLSYVIEHLLSHINRNIFVFLGGATASGKTFITDNLVKNFETKKINVYRLCTDDYVRDTKTIRRQREKEIIELAKGKFCSKNYEKELKKDLIHAKYEFNTLISSVHMELLHEIEEDDKKIILVEGDILLDIPCDLCIFLDVSDEIRKQRFLKRNVEERGYSYQEAKEKFRDIYEYQHLAITSHMIEQADLVISNVNEKYFLFANSRVSESQIEILTSIRQFLINNAYCNRDSVHLLNTEKWFCLIWKYLYKSTPPVLGRAAALLHDSDRVLNKKNQYSGMLKKENYMQLSTMEIYKNDKKNHSIWCANLACNILEEKLNFKDKILIEGVREIICCLEPMDRNSQFGNIVYVLDQADAYSFFQKNIEHYRKTRDDINFNTKISYTKERLNDELRCVPEIDELTNWVREKFEIDIWEKQ